MLLFPQVFSIEQLSMAASGNVTKYTVSLQFEQYDGMSVYNGTLQ